MKKHYSYSIKLYGRGTWERRYPRWGQLTYTRPTHQGVTSSSRSIVWLDGDWRAYRMWPYLCYSGDQPIRYRRLTAMQTICIYTIALQSRVRHIISSRIPALFRIAKQIIVSATETLNPVAIIRHRRVRRQYALWLKQEGL